LDDKSAGFDLESSEIRDANALSRLCLILAVATFYLVSTGTAVVEMGRRWAMWLSELPDPVPAMASWKQFLKLDLRLSRIEWL
jgi:hypothetical protein